MSVGRSGGVWLSIILLTGVAGVRGGEAAPGQTGGGNAATPPRAAAPAPPGSVQSSIGTAQSALPSGKEFEERVRRLDKIRELSEVELTERLSETAILDAGSGLPLLRERAFCRVAAERAKQEVEDLSSIPELQRGAESLRSPAVQAKLKALATRPPNEMLQGLLVILNECSLTFEDMVLLSRLKKARRRVAKYEADQEDVERRVASLIQDATIGRTNRSIESATSMYDKVDEQIDQLRKESKSNSSPPEPTDRIDAKAMENLLKLLSSP